MVAVGRLDAIATLLTSAQTALLHEPGDAIASMVASSFAQLFSHARTAVSLPALAWIVSISWRAPGFAPRAGLDKRAAFASRSSRWGNVQMAAKRKD